LEYASEESRVTVVIMQEGRYMSKNVSKVIPYLMVMVGDD
jgi:hypothetical protein